MRRIPRQDAEDMFTHALVHLAERRPQHAEQLLLCVLVIDPQHASARECLVELRSTLEPNPPSLRGAIA